MTRHSYDVPGIAAALLVALTALVHLDSQRLADPDLFVTLYSGQEIANHGFVPYVDTVTFSVAGEPWTDYEWLARVIFFGIHRVGGAAALVLMRLIVGVALLGLLASEARRRAAPPLAYAGAAIMLAAVVAPYFLFRPRLFTFLALALLVVLIGRARAGATGLLWWLPALFLLWTNVHAGFPLGIAVVGLLFGESLLDAACRARLGRPLPWFGEAADPAIPWRLLVGPLALSLIATTISPFGAQAWSGILRTLGSEVSQYISEWQPMLDDPVSVHLPVYWMMLVLVFAFAVARRQATPFDAALVVVLGAASLARVRFVPLFGLVGAFVLVRLFPHLLGRLYERRNPEAGRWELRSGIAVVAGLLLLVSTWLYEGPRDLAIRKAEYLTPVAAVKFLKANGITGRILNDYDWGGYIRYEMPDAQIFVDGRSDTVYPPEVLRDWSRFVRAGPGGMEVADRFGAEIVLVRADQPVVISLTRTAEWISVYRDRYSRVFLRRTAESPWIGQAASGRLKQTTMTATDYLLE